MPLTTDSAWSLVPNKRLSLHRRLRALERKHNQIHGKLNAWIDVVADDYVDGDGTDESTGLQAALDDADTDGIAVMIPYDATVVAKEITTNTGQRLYGPGTLKLPDSQANFTRILRAEDVSDVVIDGLVLDGNNANQTPGNQQMHALQIRGSSNVRVRHCTIKNPEGDGINIPEGSDILIESNLITGPNRAGIAMTGGTPDVDGIQDVQIIGNRLQDTATEGVDSEPNEANDVSSNVLVAFNVMDNALSAVGIDESNVITGWRIIGNTIGKRVAMSFTEDLIFALNHVVADDVVVDADYYNKDLQIVHNHIEQSGNTGPVIRLVYTDSGGGENVDISHNRIISAGGIGLQARGYDGLTVADNRFHLLTGVDKNQIDLRPANNDIRNSRVAGNTFTAADTGITSTAVLFGASMGETFYNSYVGGNIFDFDGSKALEFTGAGTHDVVIGPNVFGPDVTTAITGDPRSSFSPSNVSTDRTYDADSTSVAELADVLGTLIADLQANGALP